MPSMSEERAERIAAEVIGLWSETFGDKPPVTAPPDLMIRVLVDCLKDVGPWTPGRPRALDDLE